jgi:mycofactocin precursor
MVEQQSQTVAVVPGQEVDAPDAETEELIEADLLVEDISIDGMCGVY